MKMKQNSFKKIILISVLAIGLSGLVGCGNKELLVGEHEVMFYESGLDLISPDSSYMRGNLEDKLDVEGWKGDYQNYNLDEQQSEYISNIEEFVELLEYGMTTGLEEETVNEILNYQNKSLKSYREYKLEER